MVAKLVWALVLAAFVITSCAPATTVPVTPTSDQPSYPPLVEYWVIDNGCGFSRSAKENAYRVFQALTDEHIARVAVVCQTGISGGPSEASTWISNWLNHEGLGTMEDKRAVAILIRPDVPPSDYRVSINPNDDLYWFTPSDEYPIKNEAANYCNYNDFDGCLTSLARNVDVFLRAKWKVYGPTPSR